MLKNEMESKTALVLRALDSDLRRELLRIAAVQPLDAEGFYNSVIDRGFNIRYKESVYKELQSLVEATMIDKYYDIKSKKILYRLSAVGITVNLKTMETSIVKNDEDGNGKDKK